MSEHLSSQQIDEWLIGQRTRETEEHLRTCRACADEVQNVAGPLQMFGSAVRNWGEELGPARWFVSAENQAAVGFGGLRGWRMGRLALLAAGLAMMIAVPVYRREELKRQAAVAAVQDDFLLRQVESGLSRSVPAPMEPLAKLMSNDLNR